MHCELKFVPLHSISSMTRYEIIHPDEFSEQRLEEIFAQLPEWRKAEAQRFKFRQGQVECALSYWLLSQMAGFQPDFIKGEHGKPTSQQPQFHFNLSHCKQAVACAISDESEVGIDVESLGRYKPSLAEYCMNDEELKQIAESDDMDATFTLLWTKKEALLKLTGEGITDDLKNCLLSERMKGVTFESGVNKERGYAWSLVYSVHSS